MRTGIKITRFSKFSDKDRLLGTRVIRRKTSTDKEVDPRIADRGRSVKRARRRRFIYLGIGGIVFAIFLYSLNLFFKSSLFSISKITVKSTDIPLALEVKNTLTRDLFNDNYFSVSIEMITQKIMQNPLVAHATVRVNFPNTIEADITVSRGIYLLKVSKLGQKFVAIGNRNQVLPNGVSVATASKVCIAGSNFNDQLANFRCAQTSTVDQYMPYLPRISLIGAGLEHIHVKGESFFVFSNYGIGVLDSLGRYLFFSEQGAISFALSDLSSLPSSATDATPVLVDLSVPGHPTVLAGNG